MITVVIPAFDEAATIGAVLDALPDRVDGHPVTVTVVSDGSTDATASIAAGRGADVVDLPHNQGKGAALRAGMARTGAPAAATVWMDGDGQHDPGALESVVGPILDGTAHMVVGSRYLGGAAGHRAPLNRRAVRRASIAILDRILGARLTDPFSGYRAFSPEGISSLELCGNGYQTELEVAGCVARAGLAFREVPVPRIYGENTSKMGRRHGRLVGRLVVVFGYGRTMFGMWRRSRTHTSPRRLVSA